jgi:putative two-component system response regulator
VGNEHRSLRQVSGGLVPPGVPAPVILLVDDDVQCQRTLERLLSLQGYVIRTASDGASALRSIDQSPPDLVLLDVQMPAPDGFQVCRLVKEHPATRLTPVVLLTGLLDHDSRVRGIDAGADDVLGKPFETGELTARLRSLLRVKQYTDGLESAESVIMSLALTVESRDPYTAGHCQRLAEYSTAVGAELGLSDVEQQALYRGGFLHDIGKIGIPDAILLKETSLTRDEYTLMKAHTVIGDRLCGNMQSLRAVRSIVRHHHEFLDGSGYPDGLRGDDVPLLAQIVAIADSYDAMTTSRPYRAALSSEHALRELRSDVAKGLRSADLVETFIAIEKRRWK